ncbi:MAG TPA: hypothetical protein VHP62_01930 [Usitatibacter sp.]|jgi:hypothetical protein|nr:hypothetical protein [Usitatibacter sp.]
MPESSPNTARSTGAQATDRTYTADEVRELMAAAWFEGRAAAADIGELLRRCDRDVDGILAAHEGDRG